ncbi:MAG: hypothetical protein QXG77_03465 [Nitrososphaerota archaeon]
MTKVLRRVIKLGSSFAVSFPAEFVKELDNYVWVEKQDDGTIKIAKARVE